MLYYTPVPGIELPEELQFAWVIAQVAEEPVTVRYRGVEFMLNPGTGPKGELIRCLQELTSKNLGALDQMKTGVLPDWLLKEAAVDQRRVENLERIHQWLTSLGEVRFDDPIAAVRIMCAENLEFIDDIPAPDSVLFIAIMQRAGYLDDEHERSDRLQIDYVEALHVAVDRALDHLEP